jgi:hypothetical protein
MQPTDWLYNKQELIFSLKGKEIEMVSGNTAIQQYMMKYSKKMNLLLIWNEFSDDSDMLVKFV